MEKLKFIDLFSGKGGVRQGFERNGHECIAFSEIDKYAITAYKTLYGDDDIELGDVSQISDEELGVMSEDVGLVVGGSPCQSFSISGKRGGFNDVRGSLFFEYCRVLKQTRPKFFLFENVKGLLSSDKGKTIDTVIRTFNEVGYTVDFNIMNSKYFDVPQNRERVFVVGVRNDLINHEEWFVNGAGVLAKTKRRLIEEGDIYTFNFDWPKQEVVAKRLKDILETNVDEKFYLDDVKAEALVKQLKEEHKLKAPVILHNIYGGFKEEGPRVFEDISPTIRTAAGGGHLPSLLEVDTRENKHSCGYRIRKITPRECWRLQSFSDEDFDKVEAAGISNTQLYKLAGNSVTINVIDALAKNINELHKTLSKRNTKVYN